MWKSSCRGLATVGACLWAGFLAAGCGSSTEEGPVVARVGSATLTLTQLANEIPDGEAAAELRRLYVDGWVRRQLLYQEALEREVDRTPRVRQLVEQAQRDLVVAAFLDDRFDGQRIDVSESDVEQYYHLNADDYRRADAEIRVQHILLGSRRDATALRGELQRGAVFDDKVLELSIDRETNTTGGDLGYFTADERPEIWEACSGTLPGQLCRTAIVDGGYHIARLADRKEAGTLRSLDEPMVRARILETLVRQRHRERLDELVQGLRDKHDWSVDETRLEGP